MSRHGRRLTERDPAGLLRCPDSGFRYREDGDALRCVDHAEDEPLPE
jgi:UDP-2-acetamido-3-amino-2,3-dideoxy-glucuronate N-acetyltransferase